MRHFAEDYEQMSSDSLTDSAAESDQGEAMLALARAQVYATLAVAAATQDHHRPHPAASPSAAGTGGTR